MFEPKTEDGIWQQKPWRRIANVCAGGDQIVCVLSRNEEIAILNFEFGARGNVGWKTLVFFRFEDAGCYGTETKDSPLDC